MRTRGSPGSAFDVLVVGGGPGGIYDCGSARPPRRRAVALVEKEHHPRFHIGESLLPMNLPLFEQLGVGEQIARIGIPKYGVEFVSPYHDGPSHLDFGQGWDKRFASAYEVRRSDFDQVLFRNAAAVNAQTGGRAVVSLRSNFRNAVVSLRWRA